MFINDFIRSIHETIINAYYHKNSIYFMSNILNWWAPISLSQGVQTQTK
jgi:hypothetical protein